MSKFIAGSSLSDEELDSLHYAEKLIEKEAKELFDGRPPYPARTWLTMDYLQIQYTDETGDTASCMKRVNGWRNLRP